MNVAELKDLILSLIDDYSIKKVSLFGSRAELTNREDSDIDLIVEFKKPITILSLSSLRNKIEELTGLKVDLIHGPIRDSDIIKLNKIIELYG